MTSQPHTVLPAPPQVGPGSAVSTDPTPASALDYYPPPRELRGHLNGWTYPAVFLVAIVATFLLAQAALTVGSDEPLRTALYVAVAVWAASYLPMLSATSRGRTRIRIEDARYGSDQGALVVRRSLGYEFALALNILALAAVCAVFGVGIWTDALTLPLHPPIPPWLAIAVAALLLGYLALYARRPEIRRLVLTPMHIVLPTKTAIGHRVSWTAVEQIAVVSRNNTKGTIRITSPPDEARRPRVKRIHAEKLSIGSAATYWLIRFYHDHPEARAELSDERAVQRLGGYALVDPAAR